MKEKKILSIERPDLLKEWDFENSHKRASFETCPDDRQAGRHSRSHGKSYARIAREDERNEG